MWDWLVYAALILGTLATLGGLVMLAVRVLQAWRSFKRLRRHVFRDLDKVAAKAELTLDKVEAISDTSDVDRSVASLRVSLARLAILRAAWNEATSFTALIPRK